MLPNSHLAQNGPIHISSNGSLFENPYTWTNVADYVWIDQPVYVVVHLRGGGSNG
jgi:carboxypeptidase C (cathepsin A)